MIPHRELLGFYRAWRRLEHAGACDGAGGAEYKRIQNSWAMIGGPKPIRVYIRIAVNKPIEEWIRACPN